MTASIFLSFSNHKVIHFRHNVTDNGVCSEKKLTLKGFLPYLVLSRQCPF